MCVSAWTNLVPLVVFNANLRAVALSPVTGAWVEAVLVVATTETGVDFVVGGWRVVVWPKGFRIQDKSFLDCKSSLYNFEIIFYLTMTSRRLMYMFAACVFVDNGVGPGRWMVFNAVCFHFENGVRKGVFWIVSVVMKRNINWTKNWRKQLKML